MRKFHGWLLFVTATCSSICAKHFYAAGFDIEGSKTECFCADRVRKDAPTPLPITLKWIHPKKSEDSDADSFR